MTTPPGPPTASSTYRPDFDLDLAFTLMGVKTVRSHRGVRWWTTISPEGPVTTAFRAHGGSVRADSWGPGADWALTQLPALLGRDDTNDFEPDHPIVKRLLDRFGAVRIGRTDRWYEALATGAIGQRVVTVDAKASRSKLSHHHGNNSVGGPHPAFPDPERLLSLSDADFHRVGIERSRARVLRIAARYADRLEQLGDLAGADANQWLQRLPGVGPWTAALTTAVAGGDADAVPVGDLHIPAMVTYALTGESNGDDEQMLAALEPFAGHRQRVVRMVKLTGAGEATHRPSATRFDISRL